jgi:hypothetical protein
MKPTPPTTPDPHEAAPDTGAPPGQRGRIGSDPAKGGPPQHNRRRDDPGARDHATPGTDQHTSTGGRRDGA